LAPVTIGFINQDTGSVSAYPEGKAAALAAQSYINSYLGGVAGHPLKIDTCSTDGTLTSDQNCAQQMVSDKVTYVQSGISFNSYAWDSILGPAGIPIIGFNPFTAQEYVGKSDYSFGALPVGAAGLVQKIGTLPGVKKVAIVVNTVPGSLQVVPLLQKALTSINVTNTVVTYAEGTPNLLATYATAKASGANAIIANLSTPDCIALAQATASQNSTLPIGFLGTCVTASVFKAVGNDMNGWYTTAELQDPNGNTAQAVIYRAAMHNYASSVTLSPISQDVFSNVMTGYNEILKPVGPSVTSSSALTAITNPAGGQVFMGPSYKCPGSILPAVCSTSAVVMRLKNPTAVYTPGYLDASKAFAAELK
jgi:branched-chain amino acid transport system substrate-binding protein